MVNEDERLGVLQNPQLGVDDTGRVSLSFTVACAEALKFDVYLWQWEEIERVLLDAQVRHVDNLNGKACWYRGSGGVGSAGKFLRMFKG